MFSSSRRINQGFTIVELLIVIVVIAILAAISIVAYTGIQTRAENSKTVSAVSQWAKAIRMYESEQGSWPTPLSCLGAPSTYVDSYSGRCWTPETSGWVVSNTFLTRMQPYIGSYPEPSNKNVTDNTTTQYRGAMYYPVSATDIRLYVIFHGVTTCPDISGLGSSYSGSSQANGRLCYYRLAGP